MGGLDRYYGLLDLAEKCGIFKKVSTRYELPDGKTYFGKTIEKSPEKFFTQDVLNAIDKYTQETFKYGVGGDSDSAQDEVDKELDDHENNMETLIHDD
jgi:hypothetical protein